LHGSRGTIGTSGHARSALPRRRCHDDGGWAYKLCNVFSETFKTRAAAVEAARNAAAVQQVAGETAGIKYRDGKGNWHDEVSQGGDRPEAEVPTEQDA
jgi:hypothetical protein